MRERILELREKGLTYKQIMAELGCAKSTVSYHCSSGVREKHRERQDKSQTRSISNKLDKFKHEDRTKKCRTAASGFAKKTGCEPFGLAKVLEKFTQHTKCYLTGRDIDLFASEYQFDHIIPASKGGASTLDNLGITCKEANMAKSDLSVEEFISLCREVLEYNGYTITLN